MALSVLKTSALILLGQSPVQRIALPTAILIQTHLIAVRKGFQNDPYRDTCRGAFVLASQ